MLRSDTVRLLAPFCVAVSLALMAWVNPAHSRGTEMFVCTSPDGVRTYQNSDRGEGCVPLNLNPITVVPAPKSANRNSSRGGDGDYTGGTSPRVASKAAAFNDPRTSADFNAKDDRMKILQEELRLEESKLKSLQDEYKGGQPDRLGNEKNYQKYLDRTGRLDKEIRVTNENIQILKAELIRLSD